MKTDAEMIFKTMAGQLSPDQTPMSAPECSWHRKTVMSNCEKTNFFKDYNKLKLAMEDK